MTQAQFFKGKPEIDRRRRMAQALMEQGKQPDRTEVVSGYAVKQSPLAGLAKALTSGLGGYEDAQASKMEQQKADEARQTMADALSAYNNSQAGGTTQIPGGEKITWNKTNPDVAANMLAQALMGNEDTAPLGLQTQLGQIEAQQKNASEMDLYKQKFPMELELAKQKAILGQTYGNAPAAIQIANELQKARASGDTQRVNDLTLTAKLLDKGMLMDGSGQAAIIPGYAPAASDLAQAKGYGKETGQNISDAQYKPAIAQDVAASTEIGKNTGEAGAKLQSMQAQMPRLEQVVGQLSDLGKKATYTQAGILKNSVMRQAGLPVGEGAVARAEYISKVDNEILPLLRQTFGAQFTEREGQSLKNTLGDPNKSPEEKDAVIRSFIQQKAGEIQSLQRQVGPQGQGSNPAMYQSYDQIKPQIVNWEDLP